MRTYNSTFISWFLIGILLLLAACAKEKTTISPVIISPPIVVQPPLPTVDTLQTNILHWAMLTP